MRTRFEAARAWTTRGLGSVMVQSVVYQSRYARPLSDGSVSALVRAAQERNHGAGVTGALLADNEHFFQWLEGPADNLAAIMKSIERDRRHTDVQILRTTDDGGRVFPGWDLMLALPADEGRHGGGTVTVPPQLLSLIHTSGAAVPELLPRLTELVPDATRLRRRTNTEALTALFENEVIPMLHHDRASIGIDFGSPILALQAEDLARALIAPDGTTAIAMITRLCSPMAPSPAPCIALFEPASRFLGDMWQRAECSELEVAIALSRMQHALRLHCSSGLPEQAIEEWSPEVLVAPQPGARQHYLAAALDSEALWQAGWHVNTVIPESVEELERVLSERWFDALDITLSASFEQTEWLPTVSATIARARAASRNPSLAVVVSGRIFHEYAEAGRRVSADSAIHSSRDISEGIVAALPTALRDRFRRRRPVQQHSRWGSGRP